jgi:acyl dehydratase
MTSTQVVLDGVPSLGLLFARSLLRRPSGDEDLCATELVLAPHLVDPAHLAIYQRLCGFDVTSTLPSTYLHVGAFPLAVQLMTAKGFPFPLLGLVHVQNSITQLRPVDMAEIFGLSVRAANLRPHTAGQQLDLITEARVGDELVWTAVSTYLHRSEPTSPKPARTEVEPPPTSALWRLPADLGRSYAAASGDRNPIHLSALSAKAFGFPRAIAHGMWLKAHALAGISSRLPDAYTVDVGFKTPAILPSTVAYTATRTDGSWALDLHNAKSGKPHLRGTVRPRGARG